MHWQKLRNDNGCSREFQMMKDTTRQPDHGNRVICTMAPIRATIHFVYAQHEEVDMRPSRLFCSRRTCAQAAIAFLFALCLLGAAATATAAPEPQAASEGEQIFQAQCTACHTIGKGKLVGPDLQGVTQRTDPQWLHNFILDPAKMFAANDPTAIKLREEYNNVTMPTLGLTPAQVDAVISYLQTTGGAPAAATAPAAGAIAPTPTALALVGDPAAGELLFTGRQPLTNGGPPCLTCHSISGTGALGGGALGPDLTHVAQRYGGATGLTAVLTTIAFPTMIGPFTGHALTPVEVANLVAFLQQEDARQAPVQQIAPGSLTPDFWRVLGIGLGGAVVLTLLLLVLWPGQRRSISDRLRDSARDRRA